MIYVLFVVCWLLFDRCSLFVVHCMWLVARFLLFVVW